MVGPFYVRVRYSTLRRNLMETIASGFGMGKAHGVPNLRSTHGKEQGGLVCEPVCSMAV